MAFADKILDHGELISTKLDALRLETFPPNAEKTLRRFSAAEAAQFIGVSDSYIRKAHMKGAMSDEVEVVRGRRLYTAEQIEELRAHFNRIPHRNKGEKLQSIAVVNFKGGSGKTTTAAHLAQYMAFRGYRVLALDLDPQASLTALYGIQPELDEKPSVYEILRYDDERTSIREIIQPTNIPNLDIVPANLELQEYEYDTPRAMMQKDGRAGKLFFTRISEALDEVYDDYDVVIMDCPPQLGYLTLTALIASTSVLVTVHPQMLDIMSMSQFLLMLGSVLKNIEGLGAKVDLDWFRYLVTRYEHTDGPQSQMVSFMKMMFAEEMMENAMVKSTAVSDAGMTKQTLYEVERSDFTASTYKRAREAMDAVNQEVVDLVNEAWGR